MSSPSSEFKFGANSCHQQGAPQGGGRRLTLELSSADAAELKAGDFFAYNDLVGFAETDWDAATGTVTVNIVDPFYAAVTGADDSGNAKLSVGTYVYLDETSGTPALTGKIGAGNKPFGILFDEVPSGETVEVRVKPVQTAWAATDELAGE